MALGYNGPHRKFWNQGFSFARRMFTLIHGVAAEGISFYKPVFKRAETMFTVSKNN